MTTETEATAQDQQQANSEFSAGFNDARGVQPPAEAPAEALSEKEATTTETATAADAVAEKVAETATPAEEVVKLIAGMPEADVKKLLDKVPGLEARLTEEIRKVYGRYGELQGQLKQLLQQGQSTRGKKIEAGALKRLNAEFPEMAAFLAEDLSDLFTPAETPESTDKPSGEKPAEKPEDAEARVGQRIDAAVTQVREAMEKKLLTVVHPDWLSISKDPKFAVVERDANGNIVKITGGWLATLPEEEAKKYLGSDDALVAAEAFTKFKAWTPQLKKPEVKPSGKKQERLAKAVAPTGGTQTPASTTLDDEAQFASGFNKVRQSG